VGNHGTQIDLRHPEQPPHFASSATHQLPTRTRISLFKKPEQFPFSDSQLHPG
jgi:hypothetical protein